MYVEKLTNIGEILFAICEGQHRGKFVDFIGKIEEKSMFEHNHLRFGGITNRQLCGTLIAAALVGLLLYLFS